MTMPRKDYTAIARAVSRAYAGTSRCDTPMRAVLLTAQMLAEEITKDNPNFDKHKFWHACFPDDGEEA